MNNCRRGTRFRRDCLVSDECDWSKVAIYSTKSEWLTVGVYICTVCQPFRGVLHNT